MLEGEFTGYIVSAYGITALTLVGLIVYTVFSYRARLATLDALEAKGIKRRSDSDSVGSNNNE